ncbi:MAG: amidohydrolase family protein [Bryobacteraceae bacterium]
MTIADAHIHFFSHRFYSLLAAQKGVTVTEAAAILGWPLPPEDPVELARVWDVELERNGVSHAVLIASLPGDSGSVVAAVAAFPGRFSGYFFLDPTADGAARMAESAAAEGLRGMCLFPALHGYALSDPRVGEAIEAVSSGASGRSVVFVHCGALSIGVRNRLGLPTAYDLRYGNPMDLHAVARRHPAATFVVPHFGAGLFRETLMLADLCPNVYLDTSSTNRWMRYQPPGIDLAQVFERSMEVAGAGRLLFGTDSSFFPRGWNRAVFEAQSQALDAAGCSGEDKAAILGGNLLGLLQPEPS